MYYIYEGWQGVHCSQTYWLFHRAIDYRIIELSITLAKNAIVDNMATLLRATPNQSLDAIELDSANGQLIHGRCNQSNR